MLNIPISIEEVTSYCQASSVIHLVHQCQMGIAEDTNAQNCYPYDHNKDYTGMLDQNHFVMTALPNPRILINTLVLHSALSLFHQGSILQMSQCSQY